MYALHHTSHDIVSLSSEKEKKVREMKSSCKKNFKRAFYCVKHKGHTVSFYEEYEEAKVEQSMLFLCGHGQ